MSRRTEEDDGWEEDESDWEYSDYGTSDSEDDDEDTTIACPYCGKPIREDAERCPYCENHLSEEDAPSTAKPWTRFFVVCVLLIAAAYGLALYRQGFDDYVWIPADDFLISVEIIAPERITAGEWVTLDATRTSGPWKKVRKAEVPMGTFGWPTRPPSMESQVAASLNWEVDPPNARFSVPTLESLEYDWKYRAVKFLEPGNYRIRGHTAVPAPGFSPWYAVIVEPSNRSH